MPRQFYLTADAPLWEPTTWKGGWDKTSDAVTLLLDSTKTTADISKYTIQSVISSESDVSTLYRVALARFVSGPLLAQNISGTMSIMAGVFADTEGAEFYYSLHAWASIGDTDVARGTLINQYSEPESSVNPWPTDAPKGRDMVFSAALNGLDIEDDDRIIVEVGYIARNISTAEINGALYYGTDYYSNGSPDMVRDD